MLHRILFIYSCFVVLLCLTAPAEVRAEVGDNALGVNTHVPANDVIAMCDDLGVNWIRVDGNWFSLNPAEGVYTWGEIDRIVTEASDRDLNVFITLGYTPDWVPRVSRVRSDGYGGNDEPATSDEWVTFVEAAVTRYRAMGVTHFGIWNEANLDHFWEEEAGIDAWVDKILVPGADAVRRSCADCMVLGPELAHVGDYNVALDRILELAVDEFDIISHHIYNDWPENGHNVWDGDSFLNALEDRRFFFTRASLREVLDEHGWEGEVWISETGYDALPPGDTGEEDSQAVFVTRVMEEQLARAWWTNSFFYEIVDCGVDQPECTIDGYGLTRPTRPLSEGARSFPDDYRLKPAYHAIRDFIADYPEIVSSTPAAQCGDGVDNDGDGRADSEDRGCADGTDDDESDDPPRRQVQALFVEDEITVDGVLSEWSDEAWVELDGDDWVGFVEREGEDDLSLRATARWQAGVLYLALEVTDDVHANDRPAAELWIGDSLQIGVDVARDYGRDYDDSNDHEFTFALSSDEVVGHRYHGPAGASDDWQVSVSRSGTVTSYEVALPTATLVPAVFEEGTIIGFSFLVNDNDGEETPDGTGREGWMELTSGIGFGKDPYQFGELSCVTETIEPDGDGDGDSDGDGDADGDSDGDSDGDGDGDADGDGDSDGDSDGDGDGDGDGSDDGCGCRAAASGDGQRAELALLLVLGFVAWRVGRR